LHEEVSESKKMNQSNTKNNLWTPTEKEPISKKIWMTFFLEVV
jgi:hypothetical protein